MKRITIIFSTLALILMLVGCGSSGGGGNPLSNSTAPSITSITPATGGPGTVVTIQGVRFGSFQGTSVVSYSGVTVTPSSWSDSLITLIIPQNASANGSFQVIVNGQLSNYSSSFSVSNPVISFLSPQAGNAGQQITISGQYFGAEKGNSYVSFNAQQAQIISWSSTAIVCLVPTSLGSQSGSVSVVVMVDGNRSSNIASFNFSAPAINSISPASDNIGAVVAINGQGFGQNQSLVNGQVTYGGQTAQILSWNDSLIQFRVPQVSAAGTQSLVVTVNGKQISNSFTVENPVANSFSPNPATENQLITISGLHFGASTDSVSRNVQVQDAGFISSVNYSDNSISFIWPIQNTIFGTQQKTVTISIGGLTTSIVVTAD
ncbi:MAG: IPT/TIG domain-containing protein [Candidatus Riflebacteria bacterium]